MAKKTIKLNQLYYSGKMIYKPRSPDNILLIQRHVTGTIRLI